ncbi:hypothetical protein Hanom_Chr03g00228401 [Helianthus anomalus]
MTSAGKLRSNILSPNLSSFLAFFNEENPISSELPEPEGRSDSDVPPVAYTILTNGSLIQVMFRHCDRVKTAKGKRVQDISPLVGSSSL